MSKPKNILFRAARRLSPIPQDRAEVVLFGIIALCAMTLLLTGCHSDAFLPATREYAAEVAADNAEAAAAGNPMSAIIHSLATLGVAIAGAGALTKRAVQKYDEAPFTAEDLDALERAKKVAAIDKTA